MPEKWTLKLSQMSSEFVNTLRRTFFSHICFGQFSSIIYIYIYLNISVSLLSENIISTNISPVDA